MGFVCARLLAPQSRVSSVLAQSPKPSLDPFPHPHAINPIAERTKNYAIVNLTEFPNSIRVIYVIGPM